jgi:hypothetical protein
MFRFSIFYQYSNYIFNFPTTCTYTIQYLYRSLNVSYMLQGSLRHPLGEKLLSFFKTILYCQFFTFVELRSTKISNVGFFTVLFTIIKTILARCSSLKFFKNINPISKASWHLLLDTATSYIISHCSGTVCFFSAPAVSNIFDIVPQIRAYPRTVKVQGEHKVFFWLETFITRKLRENTHMQL